MRDATLKPCPFCGSDAEWIKCHEASAPFVRCVDCWGQCDPDGWSDRPGEDTATARAEAAEQRAEALAAELAQARADQAEASGFLAECHKQLDELEGILSDTLAARARAEAEAERLRSAIAETLRLADIYAGVAAHNAEAEPETAGEAWRSAGAATVRELRRALGGAA